MTVRTMALLMVLLLAGAGTVLAQDEAAPAVEFEFGLDVDRETRTLTGSGTEFAADVGKIYCLTRLRGLAELETVTHVWYHEGRTTAHVELPVGSDDWRTWSSKNILPIWTGSWEVKVLDDTGKVLGAGTFTVNRE